MVHRTHGASNAWCIDSMVYGVGYVQYVQERSERIVYTTVPVMARTLEVSCILQYL
jgi:hypothetical protein